MTVIANMNPNLVMLFCVGRDGYLAHDRYPIAGWRQQGSALGEYLDPVPALKEIRDATVEHEWLVYDEMTGTAWWTARDRIYEHVEDALADVAKAMKLKIDAETEAGMSNPLSCGANQVTVPGELLVEEGKAAAIEQTLSELPDAVDRIPEERPEALAAPEQENAQALAEKTGASGGDINDMLAEVLRAAEGGATEEELAKVMEQSFERAMGQRTTDPVDG